MYVALAACVCLHQFVVVMARKTETDPLRIFLIRVVEYLGRVLIFPLVLIHYSSYFFNYSSYYYNNYEYTNISFYMSMN